MSQLVLLQGLDIELGRFRKNPALSLMFVCRNCDIYNCEIYVMLIGGLIIPVGVKPKVGSG